MRYKVCLTTPTPCHYREGIYKLLEDELGCSFVLGNMNPSIKPLPPKALSVVNRSRCHSITGTPFYWLSGVIKEVRKYDIIIDDMGIFCLTSWLNLFIAKLRSQKVYMWSHGWYGRESLIKKWIKRAYSAFSDGMFLYGEYARKLMIENGFNPEKLHVIHNSLNYNHQLKIRQSLNRDNIYEQKFGNNQPVIIFIGRLTKVKRLGMLLDALDLLKRENYICNLVIIGDGEMRAELRDMISAKDIDSQVWMYGPCYDEEINAKLIYNADLCVAPGNVGLTAIHAMMFGCPCISHDSFCNQMPEFEAIVPFKTGNYFKYDNVYDLADKIKLWFTRKDYSREEIRQSCYWEIDHNWNPNIQVKIIKSVIEGINK